VKTLQTKAIVLTRTEYGEADRIITFLTPEQGKLRLMARGVRKIKSKLAGGIELFSVSDLSYIAGRKEIGTLVSTRLINHYGRIIQDIDRVQLGYELIKELHKATEDNPECDYYDLMVTAFQSLDDANISLDLIRLWFEAQLLKLAGHSPNLTSSARGEALSPNLKYNFDFDSMAFSVSSSGRFRATHIKTLRLLLSNNTPVALQRVEGLDKTIPDITPLVHSMLTAHIRI
jgi:DNA repair protein RecO (recombination protein O)